MRSLFDANLHDNIVLVRSDFNVPIENGRVIDTTRIDAAISTIDFLLEKAAKVCICSHLGNPRGEKNQQFSLAPILDYLKGWNSIELIENYFPRLRKEELPRLSLLENLRFYKQEEENDTEFSMFLAGLCDVYVNDAFSVSHRAHASVVGVCNYVKEKYPGFLLEKEINALDRALNNQRRPVVIILGGLKVSTKLPIIKNLLNKADYILIGGAMANTFWASQGVDMKDCFIEPNLIEEARRVLSEASRAQVLLAQDFVCEIQDRIEVFSFNQIPQGAINFDIGPKTVEVFSNIIAKASTILWNGPLGKFEDQRFYQGTKQIVEVIKESNAFKVAGGGDTVAFLNQFNLFEAFDYVSLAGGAFLEYLEKGSLPGIDALLV